MTSGGGASAGLAIATHNAGKIREFEALLSQYGVAIRALSPASVPDIEETGRDFSENALLKARSAVHFIAPPVLADDSGLCVEALGGAPGIYSARWAGTPRNFDRAMHRIHAAIGAAGVADANGCRAYFISVIAFIGPNAESRVFTGRTAGCLAWPPRGSIGVGYEPMFVPDGQKKTYGELSAYEKNHGEFRSHRARAVAALMEWRSSEPNLAAF